MQSVFFRKKTRLEGGVGEPELSGLLLANLGVGLGR